MTDQDEPAPDELLDRLRQIVAATDAPAAPPLILRDADRADEPVLTRRRPPPAAAPMFDEEALRGIVADIVREQVDSTVTEALDRHVRELVRREMAALLGRLSEELSFDV